MKIEIKKLITLAIFIIIGFAAMQVPFSQLIGAQNLKFSLFDFYGPIAGAFFSSAIGLITVFVMQIINWAWHGFHFDLITLLRFLPMLMAVIYFSRKTKWILLVPGIAMILFWTHPEGRGAWYYALYWTIPFLAYLAPSKYMFARALGATFCAHCVGSVAFLYVMGLKSAVWVSLIPVVWKERVLMAIGITVVFYAMNALLGLLVKKIKIELPFVKLHKLSFRHRA